MDWGGRRNGEENQEGSDYWVERGGLDLCCGCDLLGRFLLLQWCGK